ncbi:brachyurin [Drosophila sechellia]|uniref:GM25710 n=1 Tax=Drosophila sechellia TaxID=7238 RepID=B4HKU3_DROSE|nr:brachyurin [Drosophila sechellia]EDW41898.1 GM25710 [Drosophila sechellia]
MMKLLVCALLVGSCTAVPLLTDVEPYITNGEPAEVGQFPYQAGLNISFGNWSTWCGGSLISHYWIITAAHCMDGAESVTVYLGAINIGDESEEGQERIFVEKSGIIVHSNYMASSVVNDISLIRLPAFVGFTDRIRAATLPRRLNGQFPTYESVRAFASGWGRKSDASDSVSPVLRYVEMPIMPYSVCRMYWSGAVSEKMICMSTTSGKSTCHGDSGGPLVYKQGNSSYLIGSTSFGTSMGCQVGFPAVFTRISSYLDWILNHIIAHTKE